MPVGLASIRPDEEGLDQIEKRLVKLDFRCPWLTKGGVGGQHNSSGDGGSRCEVKKVAPACLEVESSLAELLRRNLAFMVS